MIQNFVNNFMANSNKMRVNFTLNEPSDYIDIVRETVRAISNYDTDYDFPDPNRIHVVDDGDYQGTLVFVIAGTGYQPSDYWYVSVDYGSCSGCDTLLSILDCGDENSRVDDYMKLALHIVQRMKKMDDRE